MYVYVFPVKKQAERSKKKHLPKEAVREKDWVVTINGNMEHSDQFRIAASKDKQIPGMIRRNQTFITKT